MSSVSAALTPTLPASVAPTTTTATATVTTTRGAIPKQLSPGAGLKRSMSPNKCELTMTLSQVSFLQSCHISPSPVIFPIVPSHYLPSSFVPVSYFAIVTSHSYPTVLSNSLLTIMSVICLCLRHNSLSFAVF